MHLPYRSSAPRSQRACLLAVLVAALAAASCATDEAPPPARVGAQPVPVSSSGARATQPVEDAGGATDASSADAASDEPSVRAKARTAFIYNRVLAKLADPNAVDVKGLTEAVEARTGARVKEIKKGPMGLLSIIFEDVSPPRGEAEQRALVEKLKGMQELRYAEPERLLQAR